MRTEDKASISRTLWPALSGLGMLFLVLCSALLPLWTLFGVPVAGVIETGQAEPMRWWVVVPTGALMLSLLWRRVVARVFWLAWIVAGMLGSITIFCVMAGGSSWRYAAHARAEQRLAAGVMSALPLFWKAGASPKELIARANDQAFVQASALHMQPVDHLDAATLAHLERLLLAQPRLLQPGELVALDGWVRGGGRLVILADPLLMWPMDLPMGDARRPPLTSLLDPLLTHWGLRLDPVAGDGAKVERRRISNGAVLLLAGASKFTRTGGDCRLREQGLFALCRLGRGQVRLIADADMIDDRLWLVRADMSMSDAAYASDAMGLIDGWLVDPTQDRAVWPVNRVRDEATLIRAMRWALLFGLAWVGLGVMVVRRWEKPGKTGTAGDRGAIGGSDAGT